VWAWGWSWGVHSFLQKDPKWGQFAIIDVLYPMESHYMESYLGVKITPKFDRPVHTYIPENWINNTSERRYE